MHRNFADRRDVITVGHGTEGMQVNYGNLTFERLGHASVRIETGETIVYIDPWSNVVSNEPGDGSLVFVTHDDFDHCDPAGIDAVAAPGATVVAYEAIDTSDLNYEIVTFGVNDAFAVDGIEGRTVAAYNDPADEHVDEDGEPYHAEGEVVGLIINIAGETVYFPSDTDFLSEHRDIRADVFLPPIGGTYTIDRHQAAEFARNVDPDLVLPVHYDTFDPIETDAEAFAAELETDGYRVELF